MPMSEEARQAASERMTARWAAKREGTAVAELPAESGPQLRSVRGRRRAGRDMEILTPLEQIRYRPGDITGAWAYYLRPEGATIADALVLWPNGAKLSREEDPRGRFSENAEYYQSQMTRKGFEYIGPTLTADGVRRLVAVLQENKEDELLDLEDQIEACDHDIKNSDRPEWRDNQRKRKAKLQRRLEHVRIPIDAQALTAELNEIARAQRMARIAPEVLAIMREMQGELDAKFTAMVQQFQSRAKPNESEQMTGVDRIGFDDQAKS